MTADHALTPDASVELLERALVTSAGNDDDWHVTPANQDHIADPACWCQPLPAEHVLDWTFPGRVWLHRRAHDEPHHERTIG